LAYADNVFVNCPFDPSYTDLFRATIFAVYDCGYVARCALELGDASQARIDKIYSIISECRLGIHDISRVEPDPTTGLPRFNMPLELGIFLGAKRFGSRQQKTKLALILDSERYRYQRFISDIAGQDIDPHEGDPAVAVRVIRDWLQGASNALMPSGSVIFARYGRFREQLPALCHELKLDLEQLTFNDFAILVAQWLKVNAP